MEARQISFGYEKLYFRIQQLTERYEKEVQMFKVKEREALKKADEMLGVGNLPQWDLHHEIAQSYTLKIKSLNQVINDLEYNLNDIEWEIEEELTDLEEEDLELLEEEEDDF